MMALGWAALIKNICRNTLLSASASLIAWEGVLGLESLPFPGSRDGLSGMLGWVCQGLWDVPYNRIFLLFPGFIPSRVKAGRCPGGKGEGQELSWIFIFIFIFIFGASSSLPLSPNSSCPPPLEVPKVPSSPNP